MNAKQNHINLTETINSNPTFLATYETMTVTDYFQSITRTVIRKIAFKGITKNGKTLADRNSETCMNIVFSGYQTELYNDILQSITETILYNIIAEHVYFDGDTIIWKDYHQTKTTKDENGNEKEEFVTRNYIFSLWQTVRETLTQYGNRSDHPEVLFSAMTREDEEGNEYTEIEAVKTQFAKDALLSAEYNTDPRTIKDEALQERVYKFFDHLETRQPKRAEDLIKLIIMLSHGYTGKEIAERLEKSENTISTWRAVIKQEWAEFTKDRSQNGTRNTIAPQRTTHGRTYGTTTATASRTSAELLTVDYTPSKHSHPLTNGMIAFPDAVKRAERAEKERTQYSKATLAKIAQRAEERAEQRAEAEAKTRAHNWTRICSLWRQGKTYLHLETEPTKAPKEEPKSTRPSFVNWETIQATARTAEADKAKFAKIEAKARAREEAERRAEAEETERTKARLAKLNTPEACKARLEALRAKAR